MTTDGLMGNVLTRRGVAVISGASLAVGFAVAQGTGVRALGGAVLLAGLALCIPSWTRRSGALVAAVLVVLFVAMFAASHILTLGLDVPAWLSVSVVSLVQGAASYAFDRGRPSSRSRAD